MTRSLVRPYVVTLIETSSSAQTRMHVEHAYTAADALTQAELEHCGGGYWRLYRVRPQGVSTYLNERADDE